MSDKEVSRRDWLKYVGTAAAGLAVGGAVGYYSGSTGVSPTPSTQTITNTVTAAISAASSAGSGSPFNDVHVILEAGGGEGDPFSDVIVKGANMAAALLGCKVDLLFENWDYPTMADDLRKSIPVNPDGIVVNGGPGYDALRDLVAQAFSQGIIVTSQNNDVPQLRQSYGAQGYGYVGALDNYGGGQALAAHAIQTYKLAKPDEVVVWGAWQNPSSAEQRDVGFADYCEKTAGLTTGRPVANVGWYSDPETGVADVTSYLLAHPNVKLASGNCLSPMGGVMPGILQSQGKKPGDIIIATYDILAQNLTNIANGWYQVLLDQQQFLQGFLPVAQVCLSKVYKFAGLTIDTAAGIVDVSNYQAVQALVQQGYR